MTRRSQAIGPDGTPSPFTVDRRSFIERLALSSAALAGVASMTAEEALGALVPQDAAPAWRRVPCNLCAARCGLMVQVDRGRAVAVRGDPESLIGRGTACARGYHSAQTLYGSDRIRRALIRQNGALREARIDDALDLVASKMREAIRASGPDGVALYRNADWVLPDGLIAMRLFGEAIGSPNVDTTARTSSASAAAAMQAAFGTEAPIASYEDIDHADVFVVWNSNLAETDPVLFARVLDRRRANPATRVVVLSSRATRTSWAADRAISHEPGTELFIAHTIAGELASTARGRGGFVERHVAFRSAGPGAVGTSGERSGRDGAEATWQDYRRFLSRYTPAECERVSGIPVEAVRWLATIYGDPARKVVSLWGAELNSSANGTRVNNAIINLHLLTGKVATAGNAAFCAAGGAGELDASTAGRDVTSIMRRFAGGETRFLWVQGANPLADLPNAAAYRAAARREGRFLVVSAAYPTVTTDAAHVVLPSAMWLERPGLLVDAARRIQRSNALLAPPGDAMGEAEQMIRVAQRLGIGLQIPAGQQATIEALYQDLGGARRIALPPLHQVSEATGAAWPWQSGRSTRRRFSSGDDTAARGGGSVDIHTHADRRAWIWFDAYEPAGETRDASFPFLLETGAVLEHASDAAATRRVANLHRAAPRAYVEVNRDDASRLGLASGDVVRLVSRHGSVELEAKVDHRSQPRRGKLFAPSFDEDVPVASLLADVGCPVSGQPERGMCAVRLEKTGRRVRG